MGISGDVVSERNRCAQLLEALIDSVPHPTSLSLVITAEKMFASKLSSQEAIEERRRCIAIVDAAATRPFESKPAV